MSLDYSISAADLASAATAATFPSAANDDFEPLPVPEGSVPPGRHYRLGDCAHQ
jgi:hypothetical protein